MKIKHSNGFTLAELLIVIAIVAVLALAALIGVDPMMQIFRGYDTRRKADLYKIKTAFEAYYADHDCYPRFPLKDSKGNPSYACDSDFLKPYLDVVPCDPSTKTPYSIYIGTESATCPQKYAVYADLSNTADPLGKRLPYCPNTIAQVAPNTTFTEAIKGCSGQQICNTLYGCRNGACVKLFVDDFPSCGPTDCYSDCRLILPSCEKKSRGVYISECR